MVNVTALYSPKHVAMKALSNYKTIPLLTAVSLYLAGPGIYPKIYHRTSCPAVLICRVSNKK